MPSIEELLAANIAATDKLTAAVTANTAALLGAPATTVPAPTTKPKTEKPVKPAPAAAVEPEPEPAAVEVETEVVTETEAAPEPEVDETPVVLDRATILTNLQELVKKSFVTNMVKNKAAYEGLRKTWGIEKASELSDEKLPEFFKQAATLLG